MPRRGHARRCVLLVVLVVAACTAAPPGPPRTADAPSAGQHGPAGDDGGEPRTPLVVPEVEIDGRRLVLVLDGTRTTVAELEPSEELLHAAVRPGDVEPVTVLALTRSEDRYELRYLNVWEDEVTDLYWFPWRQQVAEDVVAVADVPTLPVWAPDGSAIAWLEWDTRGTRLRTVGWLDHDRSGNPSDDQAAYRLDEVPVGSQLMAWEVDADGTSVLRARTEHEEVWRIRLEDGEPVTALEAPGDGRT